MHDGVRTEEIDTVDQHFWLTRSVARVSGVNLSSAMVEGALDLDDYVDMVERCRTCPCRAMCENWLARQAVWPAPPPPYCAHVRILEDLRRLQTPH
ncbi:MAG: DUF6455 family protein [Antarcticimicrobium sp.]|uniref:DUF6455 family protein n=1 Tax=Antarcticimicrobium sp. TaxID=2824147 RepID=UPI0026181275|nr:DUF6455 family protein [Antarcticimicrobium sp.]MDF1716693.1 DUF6455 family protein [Antarcticimicrobium sp.]